MQTCSMACTHVVHCNACAWACTHAKPRTQMRPVDACWVASGTRRHGARVLKHCRPNHPAGQPTNQLARAAVTLTSALLSPSQSATTNVRSGWRLRPARWHSPTTTSNTFLRKRRRHVHDNVKPTRGGLRRAVAWPLAAMPVPSAVINGDRIPPVLPQLGLRCGVSGHRPLAPRGTGRPQRARLPLLCVLQRAPEDHGLQGKAGVAAQLGEAGGDPAPNGCCV